MTQPPKLTPQLKAQRDEAAHEETSFWTSDLPSTYEQLRREAEIHEGQGNVLEDLKRNIARLQDLHSELRYVMGEIEYILRR